MSECSSLLSIRIERLPMCEHCGLKQICLCSAPEALELSSAQCWGRPARVPAAPAATMALDEREGHGDEQHEQLDEQ